MIKNSKIEKIEGLDSLRFFAFLLVFLFHSSEVFYFGFLGVDFFFTLSSFLLTYLALKELEQTGDFSKRNFFIRRLLRIFPLYYLLLLISLVLLPAIDEFIGLSLSFPEQPILFWLFLANYDESQFLLPLKFFWSIAVEEQFYILFLALSLFFRKKMIWIISGLLVVYMIYFYLNQYYGWEHYRNLFFHFPNFAIGMAGGWMFYKGFHISRNSLALSLILFSILLFIIEPNSMIFNLNLSVWFIALIIATNSFYKYVGMNIFLKPFEFLGKYTYGLYMYSGFIIIFFNKFPVFKMNSMQFILELICIFIISYLSYHVFEKRFLSLKEHFRQIKK